MGLNDIMDEGLCPLPTTTDNGDKEMKRERFGFQIVGSAMAQCMVALCLLVACTGTDIIVPTEIELSELPIRIDVDGWKPMTETRATIFESESDILDDAKGGGNLTMYAYLRETGQTFIGGSRSWYFVDQDKGVVYGWRFYDTHSNRFIEYYWPQKDAVDFFAYMPWDGSGKQKHITVGQYMPGTGLSLTCQMQQPENLEDTDGQETIIAYTTDQSKTTGEVNMHFVHPFSAVSFELKQAHRDLTINWIRFNNVYLAGSTTLNATTGDETVVPWTPSGEKVTFQIPVGKVIPGQINFGAEIGGPYLVMPQSLTDATITINYHWDNADLGDEDDIIPGDEDTDPTNDIYQITRSINAEWKAGYKYRYVLNLGDNKEEILFKVVVEPWKSTGGDNNIIDVE